MPFGIHITYIDPAKTVRVRGVQDKGTITYQLESKKGKGINSPWIPVPKITRKVP